MRVRLTPEARTALEQIASYIARDNAIRAQSFVRHLQAKAREIGDYPRLYPVHPRWSDRQIRHRVVSEYLVLFVILPNRVSILDIRHGARNLEFEP